MLRPPEEWWQNTPFCGHVWFTDHVPMDVTVRASEDYPVIFQARGLLPPPPVLLLSLHIPQRYEPIPTRRVTTRVPKMSMFATYQDNNLVIWREHGVNGWSFEKNVRALQSIPSLHCSDTPTPALWRDRALTGAPFVRRFCCSQWLVRGSSSRAGCRPGCRSVPRLPSWDLRE